MMWKKKEKNSMVFSYEIVAGFILIFLLAVLIAAYILMEINERELEKNPRKINLIPHQFENPNIIIPDKVKNKSQKFSTQYRDAGWRDVDAERYIRTEEFLADSVKFDVNIDFLKSDFYAESTLEIDDLDDDNNDK